MTRLPFCIPIPSSFPFREKATAETGSNVALTLMTPPVFISMSPKGKDASRLPEATHCPSGEKANAVIALFWCSARGASPFAAAVDKIKRPSESPATHFVPSGETAIAVTAFENLKVVTGVISFKFHTDTSPRVQDASPPPPASQPPANKA
jgi:hypothetical protein